MATRRAGSYWQTDWTVRAGTVLSTPGRPTLYTPLCDGLNRSKWFSGPVRSGLSVALPPARLIVTDWQVNLVSSFSKKVVTLVEVGLAGKKHLFLTGNQSVFHGRWRKRRRRKRRRRILFVDLEREPSWLMAPIIWRRFSNRRRQILTESFFIDWQTFSRTCWSLRIFRKDYPDILRFVLPRWLVSSSSYLSTVIHDLSRDEGTL